MAEPPPGPETVDGALQSGVFGGDSGAHEQGGAHDPVRPASAAAGASCAAYGCGGAYDSLQACQCNDECAEHGSCCDDFEDACSAAAAEGVTPPPLGGDPDASCAKFGCIGFVKENPCQCNSGCQERGNCCSDFDSACAPAGGGPPPAGAAASGPPEGSCEELGCLLEFDAGRPCQCNADCAEHDSCCSDFKSVCGMEPQQAESALAEAPGGGDGEEGACELYGCVEYDSSYACQCNPDCETYDSCCSDYADTCAIPGSSQPGSGKAAPAAGTEGSSAADGSTWQNWEKVQDFPVDVVNQDYKTACEAGNDLHDVWTYRYNEGRGTDNAACGTNSDYWCCRWCVDGNGCKEKSTSTTRSATTDGADGMVPARPTHSRSARSRGDEKVKGRAAEGGGGGGEDGDPDPYDCSAGAPEGWKKNKKLWCCVVKEVVGCEVQATAEPTPAPTTEQKTTAAKKTTTSTSTTENPEADIALR